MIKKILILLIILLLVPFVLGFDFGHFPLPFITKGEFKVVGVVGASSDSVDSLLLTELLESLAKNHEIPSSYKTLFDNELTSFSENIISIGGPCANKVTALIMDLPIIWPECAGGFEEGTERIKMYNKWNKTQLIIAGYDVNDTGEAVREFRKYDLYRVKMRKYTIGRNERITASQTSKTEPPFDITYCLHVDDPSKEPGFCSCGDGVCASYEYKGECISDCGPCPDGTFFRVGECVEFIENSCLNSVCDEGEEESCPWDCPYLFEKEEKEEILDNAKERRRREEFFRRSGLTEEEIKNVVDSIENGSYWNEEETLPEEVEE